MALGAGIGAAKLLEGVVPAWTIRLTTIALLLFSVFCFVAGVWRLLFKIRAPEPTVPSIPDWLLIGVNVVLAFTSAMALYGVFFLRGF